MIRLASRPSRIIYSRPRVTIKLKSSLSWKSLLNPTTANPRKITRTSKIHWWILCRTKEISTPIVIRALLKFDMTSKGGLLWIQKERWPSLLWMKISKSTQRQSVTRRSFRKLPKTVRLTAQINLSCFSKGLSHRGRLRLPTPNQRIKTSQCLPTIILTQSGAHFLLIFRSNAMCNTWASMAKKQTCKLNGWHSKTMERWSFMLHPIIIL